MISVITMSSVIRSRVRALEEIWTKRDRRELYTPAECDFVIILI
jgi:hypothetical protein